VSLIKIWPPPVAWSSSKFILTVHFVHDLFKHGDLGVLHIYLQMMSRITVTIGNLHKKFELSITSRSAGTSRYWTNSVWTDSQRLYVLWPPSGRPYKHPFSWIVSCCDLYSHQLYKNVELLGQHKHTVYISNIIAYSALRYRAKDYKVRASLLRRYGWLMQFICFSDMTRRFDIDKVSSVYELKRISV